jgi:hypothetical protein
MIQRHETGAAEKVTMKAICHAIPDASALCMRTIPALRGGLSAGPVACCAVDAEEAGAKEEPGWSGGRSILLNK